MDREAVLDDDLAVAATVDMVTGHEAMKVITSPLPSGVEPKAEVSWALS